MLFLITFIFFKVPAGPQIQPQPQPEPLPNHPPQFNDSGFTNVPPPSYNDAIAFQHITAPPDYNVSAYETKGLPYPVTSELNPAYPPGTLPGICL